MSRLSGAPEGFRPAPPAPGLEFMSVRAFCLAHGISRSFFYRLCRQGKGPAVLKIGARTFITAQAAAEWRAQLATGGSDLATRHKAGKRVA